MLHFMKPFKDRFGSHVSGSCDDIHIWSLTHYIFSLWSSGPIFDITTAQVMFSPCRSMIYEALLTARADPHQPCHAVPDNLCFPAQPKNVSTNTPISPVSRFFWHAWQLCRLTVTPSCQANGCHSCGHFSRSPPPGSAGPHTRLDRVESRGPAPGHGAGKAALVAPPSGSVWTPACRGHRPTDVFTSAARPARRAAVSVPLLFSGGQHLCPSPVALLSSAGGVGGAGARKTAPARCSTSMGNCIFACASRTRIMSARTMFCGD